MRKSETQFKELANPKDWGLNRFLGEEKGLVRGDFETALKQNRGNPGMPIFDFTCRRCGHEFEHLILKHHDLPRCPECGSRSVARMAVSLFSCTGVQMTKQLKLESEERMKKGMEQMKKKTLRKERIKIN